jgi:hypothetical protein
MVSRPAPAVNRLASTRTPYLQPSHNHWLERVPTPSSRGSLRLPVAVCASYPDAMDTWGELGQESQVVEPAEAKGPDRFLGRRSHTYSNLPVMRPGELTPNHPDILLKVYEEICGNWRMLTDVRFKLLALLPTVAGIALVAIVSTGGPLKDLTAAPRVGLAVFGLLITLGLFVYETRNNELYDDLISRARRAEYELGVHTGAFLGRAGTRPGLSGRVVRHGTAMSLVYGTVTIAWIAAIVYVMTHL